LEGHEDEKEEEETMRIRGREEYVDVEGKELN
jgi:hypothetical protein